MEEVSIGVSVRTPTRVFPLLIHILQWKTLNVFSFVPQTRFYIKNRGALVTLVMREIPAPFSPFKLFLKHKLFFDFVISKVKRI